MRVICIDDKDRPGEYKTGVGVKEGKCYTVVYMGYGYGEDDSVSLCYEFLEITPEMNPNNLFDVDRFIPLSSIDETEMIRETNLQKA